MTRTLDYFAARSVSMRLYLCFFTGGICSVAMAPLDIWAVLIPGLGFLYGVLSRARPLQALLYSWFFAFGYFVIGLLWISNALLVDGNPFVWMLPIAVVGLPSLLSCFMGLAGYLSVRFASLSTLAGFFAFCAFFAFCEWLRGFVLTGYPWNLFGYSWAGIPQIVQILSFSNIYVLNWLTLLWLTFPTYALIGNAPRRHKKITAIALYGLFAGFFIFGAWRLQHASSAVVAQAQVKIIQANIPQSEKWKPGKMWEHFTRQVRMSETDGQEAPGKATYIVWPETALSHWVLRDPAAMEFLTGMLTQYPAPAYLMTGLLRRHDDGGAFSNSLVMIDRQGQISNLYDKHHLVPFGEYIPFQKWIPLKPVAQFTGFQLGSGPATMETPEGLKYSPVICYEIIFSGQQTGAEKPDFIVNITNDSWYGISGGPYQHFTQAVFRAVEEGVPVVRSASTGISGIIDPYGRIHSQSGLFKSYSEILPIPVRLDFPLQKSLYVTIGFLAACAISIAAGLKYRLKI